MFNSNPTRLTTIKVLKSEKVFGSFEKVTHEMNCHVKENMEDGGGWFNVSIGYPKVKATFQFIPEILPGPKEKGIAVYIADMAIPYDELKRVCTY